MAYRRRSGNGGYRRGRSNARRVSSYGAARRRSGSRSGARRPRSARRYSGREVRIVVEQRAATQVMPIGVTDAGPPPRARFQSQVVL